MALIDLPTKRWEVVSETPLPELNAEELRNILSASAEDQLRYAIAVELDDALARLQRFTRFEVDTESFCYFVEEDLA